MPLLFGPYVKKFTPLGLIIFTAFYLLLLLVGTVIVNMPPVCHKYLIMLVPLLVICIFILQHHLRVYLVNIL